MEHADTDGVCTLWYSSMIPTTTKISTLMIIIYIKWSLINLYPQLYFNQIIPSYHSHYIVHKVQ